MGLPLTWLSREWSGPLEQETTGNINVRPGAAASTTNMGPDPSPAGPDNQMTLPFRPPVPWEAVAGLTPPGGGLVNRRRRLRPRDVPGNQPGTGPTASPEERITAVHDILREHDDHLQYLHSSLHGSIPLTTEYEHYVLADALEALENLIEETGLVFSLLQRLDNDSPSLSLYSLDVRLTDLGHTVERMVGLPLASFYDLLEHLQGPPDRPMPPNVFQLLRHGEQGAAGTRRRPSGHPQNPERNGGTRSDAIALPPHTVGVSFYTGLSSVLARHSSPRRPGEDADQTGGEIVSERPQVGDSLLTTASANLEQDFTSLFGSSFPCFGPRFYTEARNNWPSTRENLQLTIAAILVGACDAYIEHIYIYLCSRGFSPSGAADRTAEQERRDRLEWVQLAERAHHDQALSRWVEVGFHLALTDVGRAIVRDYRGSPGGGGGGYGRGL